MASNPRNHVNARFDGVLFDDWPSLQLALECFRVTLKRQRVVIDLAGAGLPETAA